MTSYRILIVEDQREVSRLLRTTLETLEYKLEVVEIPSGEEAILDASRHKVDLLIADYWLPGITGIELMQKIRSYHPSVKVILITGITDPKVRKEVSEAGGDSFFIKPVPIADFLQAVEYHLGLAEASPSRKTEKARTITEPASLPDLLAGLRQELRAQAVYLLDDRGQILARAGNLPDESMETSLVTSMMPIFSAGHKVSNLVAPGSSADWHVVHNGPQDLIFAPVGASHAMLVMGARLASKEKLLKTIGAFTASRQVIVKNLQVMSVSASMPVETESPAEQAARQPPESASEDLDVVFKQGRKKLKQDEVDAYWNEAVDKQKAAPTKSDMLSYEQARQLGLAPEEKRK